MNRCTSAQVQIFCIFALLSPALASAGPAATVVQFKGNVLILQGDQKLKASSNLKIEEGATIQTMPNSSVKLQMADKSVVDVGAGTFLKVTAARGGNQKEVDLSLEEGKLRAFVRKKKPEDQGRFTIRTKSATMGVRGTQFLATAAKVGTEFKSSFFCFNGAVFVNDVAGNKLADLKPNQFIAVQAKEVAPGGEVKMEGAAPQAAPIPQGVSDKISSDSFLVSPDTTEKVLQTVSSALQTTIQDTKDATTGSGPSIDPKRLEEKAPTPTTTLKPRTDGTNY